MASYKILIATVTGKAPHPYREGQTVDGSQLIEKHIPELLSAKAIEEVTEDNHEAVIPLAGTNGHVDNRCDDTE